MIPIATGLDGARQGKEQGKEGKEMDSMGLLMIVLEGARQGKGQGRGHEGQDGMVLDGTEQEQEHGIRGKDRGM